MGAVLVLSSQGPGARGPWPGRADGRRSRTAATAPPDADDGPGREDGEAGS